MKDSTVQSKIDELGPWFHNIHLPDGRQTAPDHFLGDFPAFKWEKIKDEVPEDLSGREVLDIGCNAGYYSLKLAERGAHVTAIDLDPHYLEQAEWVIEEFGLTGNVTLKQLQVYDLTSINKKFDIVWFMGVFYHLRYPMLAMDIISRKTKQSLVFQTLTMPGGQDNKALHDYSIDDREQMLDQGWPKMAFIENEFNGDPTNWWLANTSCIKGILRSCGFKIIAHPDKEIYIGEKDPENPGVSKTWNESEYLSAIRQNWDRSYQKKVR